MKKISVKILGKPQKSATKLVRIKANKVGVFHVTYYDEKIEVFCGSPNFEIIDLEDESLND